VSVWTELKKLDKSNLTHQQGLTFVRSRG